jgi:hypothetical protein
MVEKYGFAHLSAGDLLREEVKSIGLKIAVARFRIRDGCLD